MKDLQVQNRFIVTCSLGMALVISILALCIFGYKSAVGIWIGLVMGLIGYRMIVSMTSSLSSQDGKAKGQVGYTMRYLLYGVVMVCMTFIGIPILSMLIGFLCHKASLLIYVFKERKDY